MTKKITNCKSCGAEIIWIKTSTGKNHPIKAKPKKMWVFEATMNEWLLLDCYETHFFTCPQSKQWSKSSKDKNDD